MRRRETRGMMRGGSGGRGHRLRRHRRAVGRCVCVCNWCSVCSPRRSGGDGVGNTGCCGGTQRGVYGSWIGGSKDGRRRGRRLGHASAEHMDIVVVSIATGPAVLSRAERSPEATRISSRKAGWCRNCPRHTEEKTEGQSRRRSPVARQRRDRRMRWTGEYGRAGRGREGGDRGELAMLMNLSAAVAGRPAKPRPYAIVVPAPPPPPLRF